MENTAPSPLIFGSGDSPMTKSPFKSTPGKCSAKVQSPASRVVLREVSPMKNTQSNAVTPKSNSTPSVVQFSREFVEDIYDPASSSTDAQSVASGDASCTNSVSNFDTARSSNDTDSNISFESTNEVITSKELQTLVQENKLNESYGLSTVINNLQNLHLDSQEGPKTCIKEPADIKDIFVDNEADDSFVSSTEDVDTGEIDLSISPNQINNINVSAEENSVFLSSDDDEIASRSSAILISSNSSDLDKFNKSVLTETNCEASFVVDPESELAINLSYIATDDSEIFNKLVEEDKSTNVEVSFAVDEQAAAEILQNRPITVGNNSSFSQVDDTQVNSVDKVDTQQEFVEATLEENYQSPELSTSFVDQFNVGAVDQSVDKNQQEFVDVSQQELPKLVTSVDNIPLNVIVDDQEFVDANQEATLSTSVVDEVNVSVDKSVESNQQESFEETPLPELSTSVVDEFLLSVDNSQQEFVETAQEEKSPLPELSPSVADISVNVSVDNRQQEFVETAQEEKSPLPELSPSVADISVNVSVDNSQQTFVETAQEEKSSLPELSPSVADVSVNVSVDNSQQTFVETAQEEKSPLPELSPSVADVSVNVSVDNSQQTFVETAQEEKSPLPELSPSVADISVNVSVDSQQESVESTEEVSKSPSIVYNIPDKVVDDLPQNFDDIPIKVSADNVESKHEESVLPKVPPPCVESINSVNKVENLLISSQQESTLSELLSLCSKQQKELENYQEEIVDCVVQQDSNSSSETLTEQFECSEEPANKVEQSQVEVSQEQPSIHFIPQFSAQHPTNSPKQATVDTAQQINVVLVDKVNGEQSPDEPQQIKVVFVPEVNSEQSEAEPLNQQQVESPTSIVDKTQEIKVVLVDKVNGEQPISTDQIKVVLVDEVNGEQTNKEDSDLEDQLEAEANRVCEEIHNASLKFEDDFEMNDSLEIKSQSRRSTSPRHASPAPGDDDPFKQRTRIASSPPHDVSSLPASLTSSSDSAVHVNSGRLHREASSESAGGSPKSIPSMDSGICGAEVNQSEAGPDIAPAEEQFVSSEIFKDPNAFDFLCKLGGQTATSISSRLERESLYVKFDPLVSSRDRKVYLSPCLEKSRGETSMSEESAALNDSPSRNTIGTLINIGTPTPTAKQETASTLAANKGDTPRRGGTDSEPSLAQVQFAQELLDRQKRVFEERLLQLEKQLEDSKVAHDSSRQVIAKQAQQLSAKAESEDQMRMVMREYEDTISRIVVDKEHAAKAWVKEKETLEAERNQATSDLAGAELAFTDLHQKYERAKVALQGMKKNEQELRVSNEKFQEQLVQANERYKKLKHHAEEQLQKANDEIEALARNKELENAALSGQVKQLKTKVANLENMLTLKSKENTELVAICDELVAKLGSAAHN